MNLDTSLSLGDLIEIDQRINIVLKFTKNYILALDINSLKQKSYYHFPFTINFKN